MKTFHIIDIDAVVHVVQGEKFTLTGGHLLISTGDSIKALFAEHTWRAVKEVADGATPEIPPR